MGRAVPSPAFDVDGELRRDTAPVELLETHADAGAARCGPTCWRCGATRRDRRRSCGRNWRRERSTTRSGRSTTANSTTATPTRWASSSRRRCRCSIATRARSSARGRRSRQAEARIRALEASVADRGAQCVDCNTARRATCWRASSTVCWSRRRTCATRWSIRTAAARRRWWSSWTRSALSTTRGKVITTRARTTRGALHHRFDLGNGGR